MHSSISRIKKEKRLLLENHLTESLTNYKSLFACDSDAIYALDLDGYFIPLNPACETLFGYDSEHFSKMSYMKVVTLDHLERALSFFYKSLEGTLQNFDCQIIHKNGDILDVNITNYPIVLDDEIVGLYGIARDITEIKRSRQLLKVAEEENKQREEDYHAMILQSEKLSAAGQLAAGIAHEIRNPLTSIKGFLKLMEGNDGDTSSYLEIINSEINRIELILTELLILSRPHEREFKKRNILGLLEGVKALIDTQAVLKNIEIIITCESEIELPLLLFDENQLKQVFINLLKNSIEAMPNGGNIILEVEATGQKSIQIRCIDQGIGIPKEHIEKIGQPFFTTKENGTGLGLMICMQIIQNHNGAIDFSCGGNGTTVTVTLPL
ncbi:PAS domain S-box protein [Bacillus sp. BRMEA1]|uniref:ATP-binding protein n=1 Tax=Neobacillus endophyticus TaxID=2738405 RepID=UPI001565A27B|nr:ATP-binding protein [Neobacillus endophyticus]NRD79222.1 PAS domain S-box protein [Neobacillus endophyticus]